MTKRTLWSVASTLLSAATGILIGIFMILLIGTFMILTHPYGEFMVFAAFCVSVIWLQLKFEP